MSDVKDNYAEAMSEFEQLTNKRAATLKNKGKEAGVLKLKVLFKSGRTLDERFASYDAAVLLAERAKGKEECVKAMKALDVAYAKLSEGLKKNAGAFQAEATSIGSTDNDMKTGFDILINRLKMINNRAKMETEMRRTSLKQRAGKPLGADDKLKSDIKTVYLNIRKGCEETEALMKKLVARPTRQNMLDAFTSGTGPRSISVAVTNWKILVKKNPDLAGRLAKVGRGVDPATLEEKIKDIAQRKAPDFWDTKLDTAQPGWEARATKVAQDAMAQVQHWRAVADYMKELV